MAINAMSKAAESPPNASSVLTSDSTGTSNERGGAGDASSSAASANAPSNKLHKAQSSPSLRSNISTLRQVSSTAAPPVAATATTSSSSAIEGPLVTEEIQRQFVANQLKHRHDQEVYDLRRQYPDTSSDTAAGQTVLLTYTIRLIIPKSPVC